MSALPFAIPHLDAINSLPQGLLYPHHSDGDVFLMSKGRAILADDMGLGKTRQAIVAMQLAAPQGAILVICPASLKLNWRREIRLVDPEATVEVIGGRPDRPEDGHPLRWVIVNYDLLQAHASRLHGIAWAGVILDEAHFIKNNSQRTSHLLKLLGVSDSARAPVIGPAQVYLLTGTPMEKLRPRRRGEPTLTVLEVVNREAGRLQERRYWDVALPQARNRGPSRELCHGWEDGCGPFLHHGCAALVKAWLHPSDDWHAKASQRLLYQQ
jgi:hypothetical protein